MQDIAYALRQIRKTPGFTVTVVLTLALGIGANSAIFTLVNVILPVTDPKTLIRIGDKDDCGPDSGPPRRIYRSGESASRGMKVFVFKWAPTT